MDQTLPEVQRLLVEVAGLLKTGSKSGRSAAMVKLERIAALASTLAFTIQGTRR